MMVTPSMFMSTKPPPKEKAILNPPISVQRAVVVTQGSGGGTTKMIASIASSQLKTLGAVATAASVAPSVPSIMNTKSPVEDLVVASKPPTGATNGTSTAKSNGSNNWVEQRITSPTPRHLGRQKRVVEPSITPATTPISNTGISPSNEEARGGPNSKLSSSHNKRTLKSFDKSVDYGSPDSPLSKMNIMTNPAQDVADGMLSPKRFEIVLMSETCNDANIFCSISQLEFPTPERLLPIGQHGKDGISSLVEKVREALAVPDISHLRHDSLDKSEVSRI